MNALQMVLEFRNALESNKITCGGHSIDKSYLKNGGGYTVNFDCPMYTFDRDTVDPLLDDFTRRVKTAFPDVSDEIAVLKYTTENEHIKHLMQTGFGVITPWHLTYYTYQRDKFVFDLFLQHETDWYIPTSDSDDFVVKITNVSARLSTTVQALVSREIPVEYIQNPDRDFVKQRNRLMNKAKMTSFPVVRTVSLKDVRIVLQTNVSQNTDFKNRWQQIEHVRSAHIRKYKSGKIVHIPAYTAGTRKPRQTINLVQP